jgi:hydrogenase nickel incorporation protein HypB
VGKALGQLDLTSLDLVIIENVGTVTVPAEHLDLGQEVTVTVFSVAAGDDKARKHPDLVEASDAVVLNKIDLSLVVPFDLAAFRSDVRRINRRAEILETSALGGRGVDRWVEWVTRRMNKPRGNDDASHWFG